ncbi:aldo/keto reductase [Echinicola jeungdonensis]|uniref:Aldo/keto reductase n=1 Tax=Echinicola jeungdonensis TaxID=709343 RepID=A0ABV5J0Q7_9BACT|nr:aldo/keto reductase [Echinicola jeungdonensis]MDN3667840.1 aldo/keto reductase [Echinicola jeungdonensis]
MKYRKLGKSEIKVSEVSFGCMSLKGGEQENITLLNRAFEEGINYFDTADLYDAGENEKVVGKALESKRDQVILATKVGNQMRPDGSGWDWNPSKSHILNAVDESLKRLRTDYIDLYQLHGGTIEDPIDETIEAFEILKDQGKIREYGISSIRPNVIKAYVEKSNIVSVMMQYSLFDRRPEETCLDLLANHDIGVLVRGAYAKGLLLDKPAKEYLNWSKEEVKDLVKQLHAFGKNMDRTRQLVLQYPLQHKAVASVVSGIRTEVQLMETLEAIKENGTLPKDLDQLSEIFPKNYYQNHR